MQFDFVRAAARLLAWLILASAAGCSNEVRQIPPERVQAGGTYVVAGLRNERTTQRAQAQAAVSSNVIVSEPVTPPGLEREAMLRHFGFVRDGDNGCIGADKIDLEFPLAGAGTRYVAFALPPGRYTAYARLGEGDRGAPTFEVRAGEAAYLGELTLEPNADISVTRNVAEAQQHVPAQLRAMPVGYAAPARHKICTP
jgi:hypothetical protein